MTNHSLSFEFERNLGKGGIVAGVDEVGRGALAGPLVAAAVIFKNYDKVTPKLCEVRDSKKLTFKKRGELNLIIRKQAFSFAIAEVSPEEIDRLGIGAANIVAFRRALDKLKECDLALIDGRKFRGFDREYHCLVKGDDKSLSIASASIIAKVYRDKYMQSVDPLYPDYHFGENMGYGCKKHYAKIISSGPCAIHRKSFLKKFQLGQGKLL